MRLGIDTEMKLALLRVVWREFTARGFDFTELACKNNLTEQDWAVIAHRLRPSNGGWWENTVKWVVRKPNTNEQFEVAAWVRLTREGRKFDAKALGEVKVNRAE